MIIDWLQLFIHTNVKNIEIVYFFEFYKFPAKIISKRHCVRGSDSKEDLFTILHSFRALESLVLHKVSFSPLIFASD